MRFFLRDLSTGLAIPPNENWSVPLASKKSGYSERDLHPFLAYYAYSRFEAYTRTIDHTRSGRTGYGEWVHPDMVGCHFPFTGWEKEVVDLSREIGGVPVKLYSFEIKRELNFSNLRESFFQAVSNSSWAHEGYLVAAHVAQDVDFLEELKRLSASFGIGVIRLDIEDPDATEVLFPARQKEYPDWDTINKLSGNPDFKGFISWVSIVISQKEVVIRKGKDREYDPIPEPEELKKQAARMLAQEKCMMNSESGNQALFEAGARS